MSHFGLRLQSVGPSFDLATNFWYLLFMASTTSFALSDHYREFAQRKVAEGRYGSTSEVIRAGLRLLESEEKKLDALRQAIQEGEDSGPAEPFDFEDFIAGVRAQA